MATETTTERAYKVDRNGFPLEPCTRCGGLGYLDAYRHVLNGICAKCSGRKYTFPRGKAAEIAETFYAELSAAKVCTPTASVVFAADGTWTTKVGVQAGDQIRQHGDKTAEWLTVASVRDTRRIVGEAWVCNRLSSLRLETVVTFTDGTSRTMWGNLWSRRLDVAAWSARRDEAAASARTAYESTLARRAKRR